MPKAGGYEKSKRKRPYGNCSSNSSDKKSLKETKEENRDEETILKSEKFIGFDEENIKLNKPKSESKSSKCSAKKRRKKLESLSTKSFLLVKKSSNQLRVKRNSSCCDLNNASRVISPSAKSLKLGEEVEILLKKIDKKTTFPLKIKIENEDKKQTLEDLKDLKNRRKDDRKTNENGSGKKIEQIEETKINLSQKCGSKRKNSEKSSRETKRKRSSKSSPTIWKSSLTICKSEKSSNESRSKFSGERIEWTSSSTDKTWNNSKCNSEKSALSFWELSTLQQSSQDTLKTCEKQTEKCVAEQPTKDGCGGLTLNVLYSNFEKNSESDEQLNEESTERKWGFPIFSNFFNWFLKRNNSD